MQPLRPQTETKVIPIERGEKGLKALLITTEFLDTRIGRIELGRRMQFLHLPYKLSSIPQRNVQTLTETIGKQTRAPEAPRQEVPQRTPDRAPPRQASQENPSPARPAAEPPQSRGAGGISASSEGALKPSSAQGSELSSPSLSPASQGAAKTPSRLSEQGISSEKKSLIFQQVILAAQLFHGMESGGKWAPTSRVFVLMQQFQSLNQECAKLEGQVKQLTAGGKNISPEQRAKLKESVEGIVRRYETLQRQVHEVVPSALRAQANEILMRDLPKAIALLKQKTESSSLELKQQLEAKLLKLATEIRSKFDTNPPRAPSSAAALNQPEKRESGSQKALDARTAPEHGGLKAEKGEKNTPSVLSSTQESSAEVRGKTLNKPPAPPQIIQSATDLHIFNDKMQRKELVAPLNITLAYPFHAKEQNAATGAGKAHLRRGEENKGGASSGSGGREHTQEMVLISKGPVILGPPLVKKNEESQQVDLNDFLIAAFPITNEQFSDWLNEAAEGKKIKMDGKGIIRDLYGKILCKTHWAAPTSQIETEVSRGKVLFKPLKGCSLHPAVQISWYGAHAYCDANGFCLPSEAEWEKAAGMAIFTPEEPLKKFRYGFGKDQIDLSWANFRDELREYQDNRTSPVGFYNGETVFTKGGKSYQSQHARSPWGCYDMSGNVRQWVDEEQNAKKIAKGGSYNTLPEELAVSARVLLDPELCYADTGFRVAFDLLGS